MDGETVFAMLLLLVMLLVSVYQGWKWLKGKWQERHTAPPVPTPEEQSLEIYGFHFCDVSRGIDRTVTLREKLETIQRMQTKIDLSRKNYYGNYQVVQLQWYDDIQKRYLTYDFPTSYGQNADILSDLVSAEKQRLTTSLFQEIQEMGQYGEVKTVDKTSRGEEEGRGEST